MRTLIDSGLVVKTEDGASWVALDGSMDIDVPDNLQALLSARIDRLEDGARRTLQIASVIGRSFQRGVLSKLVGLDDRLDTQLDVLQRAGLVTITSRLPEPEYTFRHSLTQEAAYSTILLRRRREVHLQVGGALEEASPDRIDELAPTLAHHFTRARSDEKALHYCVLAADAAFRMYANAEAIDHYTYAIDLALKHDADLERLIHLYTNKGRAQELNGEYDDALENYQTMVAMATDSAEPKLELAALAARAVVHATQSPKFDPAKALEDCERALTLARKLGDRAAEAKVLWALMLVHVLGVEDPVKAVSFGEESLEAAKEMDLREQLAYTTTDLGWAYGGISDLERERALLAEGRELWRDIGNLPMLANNLSISWMPDYLVGEYKTALEHGREAYDISKSIGNVWGQWSGVLPRCLVTVEIGDIDEAVNATREADDLSREGGLVIQESFGHSVRIWALSNVGAANIIEDDYIKLRAANIDELPPAIRGWLKAILAIFATAAGNFEEAEEHLRKSMDGLQLESFSYPSSAFAMLARCQLALARDATDDAIAYSDEMVSILTNAGVRTFLPDALYVKARALRKLGRLHEARDSLARARGIAAEIQSRRVLWRILGELSSVDAELGNAADAESHRAEAREVVEYIAGRIGDDDLRNIFLDMPEVREILGAGVKS